MVTWNGTASMPVDVLFVSPPNPGLSRFFYSQGMSSPPVGACRAAARVRADGREARVLDGQFGPPEACMDQVRAIDPRAIVIGTSEIHLHTFLATSALPYWLEFARALRQELGTDIPMVLDNAQARRNPRWVLERCPAIDAILLGGSEQLIDILTVLGARASPNRIPALAYRDGDRQICLNPPRNRSNKSSDWQAPSPAFDLLEGYPERYGIDRHLFLGDQREILPVQAVNGREGCPYHCTFCMTPQAFPQSASARTADDLLTEIEHLIDAFGVKNFSFWDDTFTFDTARVRRIATGIQERGLTMEWWCFGRSEWVVKHPEVVAELRRAGCTMMWIGVESVDDRDLSQYGRRTTFQKAITAIGILRDHDILPTASYIVGALDETREKLTRSIEISRQSAEAGAVNIYTVLTPLPGTPLFRRVVAEGLLARRDLRLFNGTRAVLRYPGIDAEEVEEIFAATYAESVLHPKFLRSIGRTAFHWEEFATDSGGDDSGIFPTADCWDGYFRREWERMRRLEDAPYLELDYERSSLSESGS